ACGPTQKAGGPPEPAPSRSDGDHARFPRPDLDAVLQVQDEDLAVADLAAVAGSGGSHDGVDGGLGEYFVHGDFQFELGHEPHDVFLGPVHFRESALPPAAAHVTDGHQVD